MPLLLLLHQSIVAGVVHSPSLYPAGVASGRSLPRARVVFVNKMDRVGADFEIVRQMVRERSAPTSCRSTAARRGRAVHRHHRPGRQVRSCTTTTRSAKSTSKDRCGGVERQSQRDAPHLLESIVEQDDAILHKYSKSTSVRG